MNEEAEVFMTRVRVLIVMIGCLGMVIATRRSGEARAAVEQPKTAAIFVKIDGIPGGSADEQHKGEIEALSFNWSVKLAKQSGGGTPDPHDALILKPIDLATP